MAQITQLQTASASTSEPLDGGGWEADSPVVQASTAAEELIAAQQAAQQLRSEDTATMQVSCCGHAHYMHHDDDPHVLS